jgi:hypothetical protein
MSLKIVHLFLLLFQFSSHFSFQDTGDSDSESEQERLAEYDAVLKENAPDFALDGNEDDQEVEQDSPEWYQLHLATERIKTPEVLFQVIKCKAI